MLHNSRICNSILGYITRLQRHIIHQLVHLLTACFMMRFFTNHCHSGRDLAATLIASGPYELGRLQWLVLQGGRNGPDPFGLFPLRLLCSRGREQRISTNQQERPRPFPDDGCIPLSIFFNSFRLACSHVTILHSSRLLISMI